jgi:ammonium transporter Rh
VVNTILGLCASTVATFWTSIMLSHNWKIRPVDVQNATLSGGVALGAICHFTLDISGVLMVGVVSGAASTLGFARLQEYLDNKGLHDTCGVHNLHGIPSMIGAISSVILAAYKGPQGHDYPEVFYHRGQWKDQLLSIIFTLAVAIPAGLLTGYILKFFSYETTFYSDEPFWEVMDDFGHSRKQEVENNMEDIEAGLAASKMLRKIIAEYGKLGFKGDADADDEKKVPEQEEESKKEA